MEAIEGTGQIAVSCLLGHDWFVGRLVDKVCCLVGNVWLLVLLNWNSSSLLKRYGLLDLKQSINQSLLKALR